jgi:hypothetical protein
MTICKQRTAWACSVASADTVSAQMPLMVTNQVRLRGHGGVLGVATVGAAWVVGTTEYYSGRALNAWRPWCGGTLDGSRVSFGRPCSGLASSSKAQSADLVRGSNAGVVVSELIEENQKTVNEIYLATIGKDEAAFTAGQVNDIFSIAILCPMIGGNAVFKARSLYWFIDDSYEFDDVSICLPYGIVVKSLEEQQSNALSVIPNPASDEATLILAHVLKDPGTLIIYDAVGAEVMRRTIPAQTVRFAFGTAALTPALYHYKVLTAVGAVGYGKLTIVH